MMCGAETLPVFLTRLKCPSGFCALWPDFGAVARLNRYPREVLVRGGTVDNLSPEGVFEKRQERIDVLGVYQCVRYHPRWCCREY